MVPIPKPFRFEKKLFLVLSFFTSEQVVKYYCKKAPCLNPGIFFFTNVQPEKAKSNRKDEQHSSVCLQHRVTDRLLDCY